MELIMNTDLENYLPKQIDFNYDQLKSELSERLEHYNNLAVTEDGIKDAKKDKASLNKLKTALDDRRKEVKKECLAPYEDFEAKVKELISMVDEPVKAIDKQIKAFDDAKKIEKQVQIKAFYSKNIGELVSLLPFEKIENPRWMNATYKMTDIEKEISDSIFKVKNDIGIIKAMKLGCEQQMFDKYLQTLDMSAAMAEKTRWEDQQKKLKEYEEAQKKAKAEAEHEATEEAKAKTIVIDGTPGHDLCDAKPGDNVVFSDNAETAENNYIPEPEQCAPIKPAEKTVSVTFENTTADFRHEMGTLCRKHNIKYRWARKEDCR